MIEVIPGAFASVEIISSLIGVFVLLMCSGFISGSETAIFSLGPADIDKVKTRAKEQRSVGAEAVLDLINDREYTLATILTLNNMVNILITLLCSHIIINTLNFNSVVAEFLFISVFVTFLLLLFGEVMPKVIASHYSISFAIKGAPVLRVLRKVCKPFASLLVRSGSKVSQLNSTHDNISLDELSEAIDITQTRNDQEKQLLSGVVNFADTEVESIMCPRVDMVALEASVGFDEVRRVIIDSGFSRIPVYKSSLDEVSGVLYVKDVFSHLGEDDSYNWTELVRPPHFVTEHKKIADLLDEFRNRRVHMAIVVDEYGSTLGLVSLEDILEEVVGEISDETDTEEQQFYDKLAEGIWLFDAKTHIGDMCKIIDTPEDLFDEQKGDAETIAGLMLEHKRRFLRKGDTLSLCGVKFTVTEAQVRKVNKIKVEIEKDESSDN